MRELYIRRKISYLWYVIGLTFFSVLSMSLTLGEVSVSKKVNENWIFSFLVKFQKSFGYDKTNLSITTLFVMIALFVLVRREYTKRCKTCSAIFSVLMSILLILGRSFYLDNSWDLVFGSAFCVLKAILIGIGYSIMLYFLINAFFEWMLPRVKQSAFIQTYLPKKFRVTFWTCFAAILIAWLPYVITFYPASTCNDVSDEIAQFIGDAEHCKTAKTVVYPEGSKTLINNHHPVAYTIYTGMFAKLGLAIGNMNYAMYLCSLLQVIAMALIYSYAVTFIKKLGVPTIFQLITLGFFMFFPLVPMYAFTLTKDGLFGGFMVLTTIGLLKLCYMEETVFSSRKEKIYMLLSCVGLTLLRNNGIYILFIVFVILLARYRKSFEKIKGILVMIGIPIVFYWIFLMKILFPLIGIPGGSPREMLSVPFQQVARYAVEWGEEGFEDGEIETLDKVMSFKGDIKVLQERYNPVLADPVKNKFNKNSEKEDLKEFMVVWARLLARHPSTFIEATLNNTYDLYSVDYNKRIGYTGVKLGYWYGMKSPKALAPARKLVEEGLKVLNESAMLGWAFSVGPWSYLFLICMLYAIYRKAYQYLIMTIPVVANVLICVAGPISYMRYAIEWIPVFPLFGAMLWLALHHEGTSVEK